MDIVIIGAGGLGAYVASFMSKRGNDVTVIDQDSKKLEMISHNMDVATRLGSGMDWRLLDELTEFSSSLLLALTKNDERLILLSVRLQKIWVILKLLLVLEKNIFSIKCV